MKHAQGDDPRNPMAEQPVVLKMVRSQASLIVDALDCYRRQQEAACFELDKDGQPILDVQERIKHLEALTRIFTRTLNRDIKVRR